jgi:hypothetical protein
MKLHVTIVALLASLLVSIPCLGAVTEFDDPAQWQAAVDQFTTINFDEFGQIGFVTDEYADLGIIFPDGNDGIDTTPNAFVDGFGLGSVPPFGPIHFVFDTPQLWIAADFPGFLRIDLYSQGELIYNSIGFFPFPPGIGNFGGLVSTQSFDEVFMHRNGDSVYIDNLYFGVPGPGALPLLALAGVVGRRRLGAHVVRPVAGGNRHVSRITDHHRRPARDGGGRDR